jgi:hypothetical protein
MLSLMMPGEADQGPRLPRGREHTGFGQTPEGGSHVGRLGLPSTGNSLEKCVEMNVH